jgi:septum formation protein
MILVLASQSPRRREILTLAGIPFVVRPSGASEILQDGERAEAYVKRLATEKARAVARVPNEIILAADTVVAVDDVILEKPRDPDDARQMLRKLANREHQVHTGICLLGEKQEIVDMASTTVRFTDVTLEEISAYVNSGEPSDKAGSYAISINGCYFNVMGLPISLVYKHLKKFQ